MKSRTGETVTDMPPVLYWNKMPYELKKAHAANLVRDFYNNPEIAGNVYVSVGGLDSITLAVFVRSIYPDVRLASVSGLEHPTNQRVHKALGVEIIPRGRDKNGEPWTLPKVYKECGYPMISKDYAMYFDALNNPTPRNRRLRQTFLDNNTNVERKREMRSEGKRLGVFSNFLTDKAVNIKCDFNVSNRCCKLMKEDPLNKFAKENSLFPYMGLMYEEGGRRATALVTYGCNYISEKRKRSCPFASFTRDDILRLALEMDDYYKEHWQEFNPNPAERVDTIVPAVYGVIEEYYTADGVKHYRTTGEQRTGCTVCGFGVHVQKRPNRFDALRTDNPKAWAVAMKSTAEGGWGWGEVLDYFGIEWRTPPKIKEQQNIFMEIDELDANKGGLNND